MTDQPTNLDKTILGEKSHWLTLSQGDSSSRILFENATVCSQLAEHKIEHAGLMTAHAPYEIQRFDQSGTFLLACLEGRGEVLIDGGWKTISKGQACLLPPYVTNAFRALQSVEWRFAWVRYTEEPHQKSVANSQTPLRGAFASESLKNIILGLHAELNQNPHKAVVSSWCQLLHQQVLKFAHPAQLDPRLVKIWNKVASDLAHDWTLCELAQIGNLSEEHLRRLNNKHLGRSPIQHLIYLRILVARQLLLKSNATIETVGHNVGYQNAFSFSNAFKKWIGCRPSEFRK